MHPGSWDAVRARLLGEQARPVLEAWHSGSRNADRIVDRQCELVYLLASGLSPAVAAERLKVTRATVAGDVADLSRILGRHGGSLGLDLHWRIVAFEMDCESKLLAGRGRMMVTSRSEPA